MSNAEPILWAFKHAPVADSAERLVLMTLADAADEDGCNAYLSQSTIAERAMIDARTVRRKLPDLESRGLIARGNQDAASHIPADKRPVVYDVLVPYVRFMDIDQTNRYRANRGRPPLTEADRPVQGPAPAKAPRKDQGVPRIGRTQSPAGQEVPPDTETPAAGHEVRERPDTESDNPPLLTLPTDPPQKDVVDGKPPTPPRDLNEGREDVDRICQHLSARLTEMGVRHADPHTKAWRDAARLMLDVDGRPDHGRSEEQVHTCIEWALRHHFWHRNIHSMPTLRDKYDRLRLDAEAERTGTTGNVRPIQNRHVGPDEQGAALIAAFNGTTG